MYNHECTDCDLCKKANRVCIEPDWTGETFRLIVVGEAPGSAEDRIGTPFVGPAGRKLKDLMHAAGIPTEPLKGVDGERIGYIVDDIVFDNIVHCYPSDGDKVRAPTNPETRACIKYFYHTLSRLVRERELNPVEGALDNKITIVALGNTALKALTGKGGITRNHGIIFPLIVHPDYVDEYGYLADHFHVGGTIHPSAVLRAGGAVSGNYAQTIIDDFQYYWKSADGEIDDYWKEYRWIEDPNEFTEWVDDVLSRYQSDDLVAMDLETMGFNMYGDEQDVVCFSLCYEEGKAISVPLQHMDCPWKDDKFITARVLADLRRLLETVKVCGWNFKFDLKWLWMKLNICGSTAEDYLRGTPKPNIVMIGFDGLLARHWLYQKTRPNDLNTVAAQELGFVGHGNDLKAALASLPKEIRHFGNIPSDILNKYASGDADATLRLCNSLREKFREADLYEYLMDLVDNIYNVALMEVQGVFIEEAMNKYLTEEAPAEMQPFWDTVMNSRAGKRAADNLNNLTLSNRLLEGKWETVDLKTGRKWSGTRGRRIAKVDPPKSVPKAVGLTSTKFLQELIYGQLKLPILNPQWIGKTGPTTRRDVLEELAEWCAIHEKDESTVKIVEAINKWRALRHTYTNFIANVPEYTQHDGFFHTDYGMGEVDSGRFSSRKPSLHGQPKRSQARQQFVSRWKEEGGIILSCDLAQAEVRVLASLSKDKNLIDVIKSGEDIHTENASRMFKTKNVTKKLRDNAKRCGFGVIYGIGDTTLAARIESSVAEASRISNLWRKTYPGTVEWQKVTWRLAVKNGYVGTVFGRIRIIPKIESSTWGDRPWRQSINNPIQSTASDVTFFSIAKAMRDFEKFGLRSKLFGFVHDSGIVDVYPGELWDVIHIMRSRMIDWTNWKNASWMGAPMDADIEIGSNWGFSCEVCDIGEDFITVKGDTRDILTLSSCLSRSREIKDQEFKDGKMTFHFEPKPLDYEFWKI